MSTIKQTAEQFFEACETGKGWAGCQQYCHPDATFAAQADALANVTTLKAYTEWMQGLMTILPDGDAEVRSFAVDETRNNVAVFGLFHGTHTGDGGPVPPTRRSRLRVRDGLRRRQDPPHDEDLERRHVDAPARLGLI
jgi:hypothetical protein